MKNQKNKYEYSHFHSIELGVRMYGAKPETIINVKVSEDLSKEPKYFGWWNYQNQDFSMVFGHLGLVNMCFAYGPWAEIERGRGEICGVKIEETMHKM